jgi:CRP-like cAMP-binding protein
VSFFNYPTEGKRVRSEQRYFLADCSEEDWKVLLEFARGRRFRAGEPVLEPDDTERAFHLVLEGSLEALAPEGRRGRPHPQGTFAAGSVIGELSFFDGLPRGVLVRAVTDGELVRLGIEDLDALAQIRPNLARAIVLDLGRILAGRLRDAQPSTRTSLG